MKDIWQYFPTFLFIMLYKVFLAFEPVGEILKCDHSNESYWAVLSYVSVYYAVHRDYFTVGERVRFFFTICGESQTNERVFERVSL